MNRRWKYRSAASLVMCGMLAACAPASAGSSGEGSPTATAFAVQAVAETSVPGPIPTSPASTGLTATPVRAPRVEAGCIAPLFASDYPTIEGAAPPEEIPDTPPIGWEAVTRIPTPRPLGRDEGFPFTRPRQGFDEIWIGLPRSEPDAPQATQMIFRTDTNEWRIGVDPPGAVFLDSVGRVWSKVASRGSLNPVLYILDDKREAFVPVIDRDRKLAGGTIGSDVAVDGDGVFWFFFHPDGTMNTEILYSFDPAMLDAREHLSGEFSSLEIDARGMLYFTEFSQRLHKYDPHKGMVDTNHLPSVSGWGDSTSLYVDRRERLWVSNILWLDTTQERMDQWFRLIPSPVFVDYDGARMAYSEIFARVMLQSIDGRLWFSSSRGNVWFEPETGQWCLFTTYRSDIVEDSRGDLWMPAGEMLYRLPLSAQR